MLDSIIGLAHGLDLTACAEGVEDAPPGSADRPGLRHGSGLRDRPADARRRGARLARAQPQADASDLTPAREPELLGRTARRVASGWGLSLGPPFALSNYSYVAPVGEDAVLKVRPPDDLESEHEAEALELWAGDGAVRLLRREPRAPGAAARARPPGRRHRRLDESRGEHRRRGRGASALAAGRRAVSVDRRARRALARRGRAQRRARL